jgi:hypothetical protein
MFAMGTGIRRWLGGSAVALAIALATASSQAATVPVMSGGSVTLSATTAAAEPDLAGLVLEDLVSPFELTNVKGKVILSGSLQARVVRSDTTGNLHFSFRIFDLVGKDTHKVSRTTHTDFDGFATGVSFRTDGLGDLGPKTADREDGTVGFNFQPKLGVGKESLFYYIVTDAKRYTRGSTQIINGGVAVVDSFAPAAVPLPAGVVLIVSGIVALGVIGRRGIPSA